MPKKASRPVPVLAPWSDSALVIGIDPGQTGAAVVTACGRLASVVCWKPVTRGGRVRYRVSLWTVDSPPSDTLIPARAGAIGVIIATEARRVAIQAGLISGSEMSGSVLLACEDAFLSVGAKSNPQVAIKIARWAGAVVAPIEETFGTGSYWVRGDEWRAPILGLPRGTKREVAKEASRRYIPGRIRGLSESISRLPIGPEFSHITDAAGIAEWRARCGGMPE